jgi:hypothetical protein
MVSAMSGDQPSTEELRVVQLDKLRAEQAAAEEADDTAEERAHGRRADKAAYLAEKLDEQSEALDQ